jgi:hypothetical protein
MLCGDPLLLLPDNPMLCLLDHVDYAVLVEFVSRKRLGEKGHAYLICNQAQNESL